jgi:signal transduction histidine kinase
LGFGGLLLIILIIGIQGITYLTGLGESIDVILRENYRSVVACQQMKEALEGIDSGVLVGLLGDRQRGNGLIRANSEAFDKALATESDNITLPGEGRKVARIRELYRQYKREIETIHDPGASLAMRRETYFSKVLSLFRQIKDTADEILRMNQHNMNEANDAARHKAASARRQMYLLLVFGAMVAAGFFFLTSRWILHPINRLIASADEIGRGNLDLVVRSDSKDEIGHLSEAFNTMAANLRESRRSDHAKLIRVQRATQRAFDSLPDSIALLDLEGRVETATELAREVFGLKPNTTIDGLKFPVLKDAWRQAIKNAPVTAPENRKTVIQQFIKGEERFFRPEAVPILDPEGLPTGIVLVLKDVTQMWQQDEMKRGIVSVVSHQLKSPLTSIRMAIHILLEERVGPLTEKQVELLLAAREDSDRLHSILGSLLDISRIESGRMIMNFEAKNPNELALEAVDLFTLMAHDKGVFIETYLPGDPPEVWADATQIAHVFSNLLSNALRYTDPGGKITISAVVEEKRVKFEITDTGRGIPPEYLSSVFEQFFRVPKQEKETGTGLGLAIVKQITGAHGGTASASSMEGKGSVFTFTLLRADRTRKEEIGS